MTERIAILSDIHGNATALDAVLVEIRRLAPSRIAVLGDIAYRGAEPKRSIELVRSLDAVVIGGNADDWLVRGVRPGEVPEAALARMNAERDWSFARLDESDIRYLAELPDQAEIPLPSGDDLYLCHATPDSRFSLTLPDASEEDLFRVYFDRDNPKRDGGGRDGVRDGGRDGVRDGGSPATGRAAAAYGHIHLPYVRFAKGRLVLNPGSVGLPFDGAPLPSFALIEAGAKRLDVHLFRIPYDIDGACDALRREGYPEAQRISDSIRRGIMPAVR